MLGKSEGPWETKTAESRRLLPPPGSPSRFAFRMALFDIFSFAALWTSSRNITYPKKINSDVPSSSVVRKTGHTTLAISSVKMVDGFKSYYPD